MKKINKFYEGSCYLNFIKNNSWVLLGCALVAIFCVLLTYLGVMYTDSYERITLAENINKWIHALLSGDYDGVSGQSWLTVVPSYFIGLSLTIIGSTTLYSFVQSFSFLVISILYGCSLMNKHRFLVIVWIFLTPIYSAFSIFYEASVGCVTAIMAMIILIWKWSRINKTFDKVITLLLLAFFSFVAFGYRANAVTILPALLLVIFFRLKKSAIIKKLCVATAILVGFGFQLIFPKMLNIDTMSSYAASFIWEIVSTIQTMDEYDQSLYSDYLDDVLGEGITQKALVNNKYKEGDASINLIWWGNPFNSGDVSETGVSRKVLSKYLLLIKNKPKEYLITKGYFILNTLGIKHPLHMKEYYYNRNDIMNSYCFNDCIQRKKFVDNFCAYMEKTKNIFRPWIMFVIAFILIVLYRIKYDCNRKEITIQEASYVIAVFYYGAFLINTQAYEFRYFFPSWCILIMIILSICTELIFYSKK